MIRGIVLLLAFLVLKQGVEVKNAWMRPGAKGMNSAVYFEIVNNQNVNDTLLSVRSDLAKVTEMHETYKKGEMMGMRRVNFVALKPHAAFSFQPGGHHIMLIALQKELKPGDKRTVTLRFKKAGEVKVTAEVKK